MLKAQFWAQMQLYTRRCGVYLCPDYVKRAASRHRLQAASAAARSSTGVSGGGSFLGALAGMASLAVRSQCPQLRRVNRRLRAYSTDTRSQADVMISSSFDSGNGDLQGAPHEVSDGVWEAVVKLRPEPFTQGTDKKAHSQWFHFRASNVAGRVIRIRVPNAGEASYAEGFKGYKPATSYDRKYWFRCPDSKYEDGVLSWELSVPLGQGCVWFAYFQPYSYEQHQNLIAQTSESPLASCSVMGNSLDGRPIDLVTIGSGVRKIWISARLHPGESMAEWAVDGLLARLTDPNDALARSLRQQATLYIVPNVNPDGSVRGHLRTNACGANLNREWACCPDDSTYDAPTLERSPEIFHILRHMDAVGCDAFIDVHGDESIEANFFVKRRSTPRLAALEDRLGDALLRANPDFQLELGYEKETPDAEVDLSFYEESEKMPHVGSVQVGQRFDCLSVTLEMPFKDSTYNTPEPICQWSGPRSSRLGASLVDAICDVCPYLRDDS